MPEPEPELVSGKDVLDGIEPVVVVPVATEPVVVLVPEGIEPVEVLVPAVVVPVVVVPPVRLLTSKAELVPVVLVDPPRRLLMSRAELVPVPVAVVPPSPKLLRSKLVGKAVALVVLNIVEASSPPEKSKPPENMSVKLVKDCSTSSLYCSWYSSPVRNPSDEGSMTFEYLPPHCSKRSDIELDNLFSASLYNEKVSAGMHFK